MNNYYILFSSRAHAWHSEFPYFLKLSLQNILKGSSFSDVFMLFTHNNITYIYYVTVMMIMTVFMVLSSSSVFTYLHLYIKIIIIWWPVPWRCF